MRPHIYATSIISEVFHEKRWMDGELSRRGAENAKMSFLP